MHKVFTMVAAATMMMMMTATIHAEVGNNDSVLNPNIAGESELAALPHMSAELAGKLIAARPFLDMLALNELLESELNAFQRSELYAELFVPINLNTASREEILLVPGLGDRMAHEFEEYRPYRAMAQFRREIGKYVGRRRGRPSRAVCLRAHRFERRPRRGVSDYPRSGCSHAARVPGVPSLPQHGAIPTRDRQVRRRRRACSASSDMSS